MHCKEFKRLMKRLMKKVNFNDESLKLKDAIKILNEYRKIEKVGLR